MISLVKKDGKTYSIYSRDELIGSVSVSKNPYHNRHFYLDFELSSYDLSIAAELFKCIRRELGGPLQVMLYASAELHTFLTAGGFERRRRCYEIEATAADLLAPAVESLPLSTARKGSDEYAECRALLYDCYRETHRSVSPLTADIDTFCAALPDTALYHADGGRITHLAFVEAADDGCEIAYLGSAEPSEFGEFARSLAARLFSEYGSIFAECDDTDPAATALRSLFSLPDITPYDTYILD